MTHEWGPVKLFHNESGRLREQTAQAGLSEHLGWWNGIAGRDLDNDGDIDYVVTNFGLNTKYHPSPQKPTMVYYGDLDDTGKMHIVEAAIKGGGPLPLRGKSCSQNAMPGLREKFPTYHSFAAASLQEIYSPQRLAAAHHVSANTLESGILLNDGQGKFQFRALPRIAQVAPAFGVALTDVDADGYTDIYLAQNFYGPQRETGRMDGGVSLLLRGNQDGSFHPAWPDESGLTIPGDATALTITDLNDDGRPDFVAAVNDGAVAAFENNASDGRTLAITLRGRPGNLAAAGARIQVKMNDGSRQTSEVFAGGGYLSQSSPTVYFGLGNGTCKEIEVRWPDGQSSNHTIDNSLSHVLVQPKP